MTLSRILALFTVALLVLGLSVSASADVYAERTDYLTGLLVTGDSGLELHAVVTRGLDLVYTYEYTLTYTAGNAPINIFSVENPTPTQFNNAANVSGTGTAFNNPAFNASYGMIDWTGGELAVGGTRTFSYKSVYGPQIIGVYTWVGDHGDSAEGETLGMGAMIPEPSSLAALLFGAVGLVPLVIRRRK